MYGCIWKRKRKSRRNPNAHFSEAEGPPTPKSALATPPAAPPATHTARGLRDACLWSGRALTHPLRPLTERGQLGKRDTGKPRHGRPRSRCAPRRSMARRRLRARAPAPRPANILGRRGGGAAGDPPPVEGRAPGQTRSQRPGARKAAAPWYQLEAPGPRR